MKLKKFLFLFVLFISCCTCVILWREKYYLPRILSKEIFDEVFDLEKIYAENFKQKLLSIEVYKLKDTSLKTLKAKDSIYWSNLYLCTVQDKKAKNTEQECYHWEYDITKYIYASGQENLKSRIINDLKYTIRYTDTVMKNRQALTKIKEAELYKNEIFELLQSNNVKYLFTDRVADEGHLINYQVYILSLETSKIFSINYCGMALW